VNPNFISAENPKDLFSRMEVITLMNGLNQVDMNGDGTKDMIFVAWRGNYNAHGYSLFTFYVDFPNEQQPEKHWHVVPFPDEKSLPLKEAISTVEGADCVLQDIRVLRSTSQKNAPVIIIIGQREFGESYADETSVKFTVLELKHNEEGNPGDPPFQFEQKRIIEGKKTYCDINRAFQEELGISDYENRGM